MSENLSSPPWKPARIEWITFLILMPMLDIVINLLLFGKRFWTKEVLVISFVVTSVVIFVSWFLHITAMHWLRMRLPEFRQTLLRVTLLSSLHVALISLSMVVFF